MLHLYSAVSWAIASGSHAQGATPAGRLHADAKALSLLEEGSTEQSDPLRMLPLRMHLASAALPEWSRAVSLRLQHAADSSC